MGSADAYNAYLQKHAIRGQLVSETPDPQLNTIIAIPAYNESGLTTCLDSLFHCDPPLAPIEVIVLINSAESSSREIVAANRQSYAEVREWIEQHQAPCYRAERNEPPTQQQENNPNTDPQENTTRGPATSQQQENIQGTGQQENTKHGQDQSKPQENLRFLVVLVEDLPDKHFGAGLARKLVMDEAVRRLVGRAAGNQLENGPAGAGSMGRKVEEEAGREHKEKVAGIIVSLDADTVVRRDYLRAVEDHFSRHPQASGCSISFEHPLSRQEQAHLFSNSSNRPNENPTAERLSQDHRTPQKPPPENFPPEAFDAVANYELHQRYYLLAVRYTGYPYAFHTVGSCFAVQAEAYCRAGGMSRRQAGEDFYFIQKLAMQGGFTECRSTRVYPSPRPSDRVPFGTGPDISRQIGNGQLDASAKHSNDRDGYGTGPDNRQLPPYLTYNPDLFEHLRKFFALIPRFYRSGKSAAATDIFPEKAPATEPDGDHPAGTKGEAPEYNAAAATDGDPPVGSEKAAVLKGVPPVLERYLEESGFWEELEEIRGNTASEEAFRKRFFNKFNMFRILKYLHFAEEQGVEKMEVTAAAGMMLEMWENAHGRGMPDGKGLELESPDRRKNEEEGSVDGATDGMEPDSGIDSPIRKKDSPKGTSTREMLLLYRKYFG